MGVRKVNRKNGVVFAILSNFLSVVYCEGFVLWLWLRVERSWLSTCFDGKGMSIC